MMFKRTYVAAATLALMAVAAPASAQVSRLGDTFSALAAGTRGSAIAFDSRNGVYLVVSTFGTLRGRFLSADGVPLGEPFIIQASGLFTHFPDVAFSPDANGGAGAFLVTWHESDASPTSVHARLVSYNSGLISADVVLAFADSWWEAASEPSVAYASVSKEFLVTWRSIGYDVRAARVSLAGALLSPAFSVTTDGVGVYDQYPRAAYNPVADEFMVAWSATVASSVYKVQRVKAGTGQLLGGAQPIAAAVTIFATDITYDPGAQRFLATWYQDPPQATYGRLVNADGTPTGNVTPLSTRFRAYDGLATAHNPVSGTFFVISHDSLTIEDGGVEVANNGLPIGGDVQITVAGGTGNFYPQIASHASRDEWTMVASRSFAQTIGQRLRTATRSGPPPPPPNPCTSVTLNPTGASVPVAGGSGVVTINAGPAGCTWTAASSAGWLSVGAGSGTGASLTYAWAANGGPGRNAIINISGAIFSVSQQGQSAPLTNIDLPGNGAIVTLPFYFGGWAVDLASTSGPGVDAVHVYAYPTSGGPIFLGAATFGPRPDLGAYFGPQFTNSGWGLIVRGLRSGNYLLVAFAHSTVTGAFNAKYIGVTVGPTAAMNIDIPRLPGPHTLQTNAFTVAGWALDQGATSGTGVDWIHVYVYTPAGPVFLGWGTLGQSRNDVGEFYGPQFTNSGWSFNVNGLASGTYTLVVYAHSYVTNTLDARAVGITVP